MTRQIDPEPITIYMATMATIGAGIAAVNYVKTHRKPPPTKTRARLLTSLTELSDHTRHLRTDLEIVQELFAHTQQPNGLFVRFGNGVRLSAPDFARYEAVSDQVFIRLRKVHKLSLKLERYATQLDTIDSAKATNELGDAIARLENLRTARDLSVASAWAELQSLVDGLDQAIRGLRQQLGHR